MVATVAFAGGFASPFVVQAWAAQRRVSAAATWPLTHRGRHWRGCGVPITRKHNREVEPHGSPRFSSGHTAIESAEYHRHANPRPDDDKNLPRDRDHVAA